MSKQKVNRQHNLATTSFGLQNPNRVHVWVWTWKGPRPYFVVSRGPQTLRRYHTFEEAIKFAHEYATSLHLGEDLQ